MTKPELFTLLCSLEALLETEHNAKALEVIKRVISQIEVKPAGNEKTGQEDT